MSKIPLKILNRFFLISELKLNDFSLYMVPFFV